MVKFKRVESAPDPLKVTLNIYGESHMFLFEGDKSINVKSKTAEDKRVIKYLRMNPALEEAK